MDTLGSAVSAGGPRVLTPGQHMIAGAGSRVEGRVVTVFIRAWDWGDVVHAVGVLHTALVCRVGTQGKGQVLVSAEDLLCMDLEGGHLCERTGQVSCAAVADFAQQLTCIAAPGSVVPSSWNMAIPTLTG